MTDFHHVDDLPEIEAFPGIRHRSAHGDQITFAVFELDPDTELPRHSHHNEQVGLITRGSVTLNGTEVGVGGLWVIPANEEHGGRSGPDGATVVEVFAPPRADWPR